MTKVEEVARAIDPEAWADDMPVPTRELVIEFHARRQKSVASALAAMEAQPVLSAEFALSAMIAAALFG